MWSAPTTPSCPCEHGQNCKCKDVGLRGRRRASLQRLRLHAEPRPRRTEVFPPGLQPGASGRCLRRLQRRDAGNGISRAGCWAHLRRKVFEAEKTAPESARQAIEMVRALYAVEKQAATLSATKKLDMRQMQSVPVLAELREKFLAWKEQLLPRHPMAEAISYALSEWQELNVFSFDGTVPVDNNLSEREMKRVVLTRKNSLFVGNPRGGRTAAILASLTSTCRRHDVDPQFYLTQLLVNLPTTSTAELPSGFPISGNLPTLLQT
jgi:hypothetical protein